MIILAIETSCDETSASIVENGTKILSNVIASSQKLHIKTGGIIPEVAAREQIKCIVPVVEEALKETRILGYYDTKKPTKKSLNILISQYPNIIDAIAVTVGPGLIGSLLIGVETAKTLAYLWQKPIIPVNHLLAHLYANWLNPKPYTLHPTPSFPAIGLIASGGHTDLLLMKGHAAPATLARSAGGRGKIKWLSGTRDDAAGEAFDKIARLLGLGYPGGPAIAAEATESRIRNYESRIKLPRPIIDEDNFDFSFSGLKTAVLREVNKSKTEQQLNNSTIRQLAYETQEAITDVLVEKTLHAAKKHKVRSILLGGGVTANQRLREKILRYKDIKELREAKLFIPPPDLCTDNAAVIASAAYFNYKPTSWSEIQANPGLYF